MQKRFSLRYLFRSVRRERVKCSDGTAAKGRSAAARVRSARAGVWRLSCSRLWPACSGRRAARTPSASAINSGEFSWTGWPKIYGATIRCIRSAGTRRHLFATCRGSQRSATATGPRHRRRTRSPGACPVGGRPPSYRYIICGSRHRRSTPITITGGGGGGGGRTQVLHNFLVH